MPSDGVRLRRRAEMDAQLPLRELPPRDFIADGDLDLRAAFLLSLHRGATELLRVVAGRAPRLLREMRLAAHLRERADPRGDSHPRRRAERRRQGRELGLPPPARNGAAPGGFPPPARPDEGVRKAPPPPPCFLGRPAAVVRGPEWAPVLAQKGAKDKPHP